MWTVQNIDSCCLLSAVNRIICLNLTNADSGFNNGWMMKVCHLSEVNMFAKMSSVVKFACDALEIY